MTTAPVRPSVPHLAAGPDELVRRFVREGDHVHAAATMSRPNALLNAVCRAFAGSRSLTVSTTAVHSSAHALALSGAVRKVITGFVGDTFPSPRPNRLYRELADGKPFEIEMWSLLSYTQRLMAAALGQPFATTGSMLAETDLRHGKEGSLHLVAHPEDPERSVTLLAPLRPRFTLFHGVCADRRGNVVAVPPLGEGAWAAYAATEGVLASVEAIVDDEVIAAMPDRVVIPAARVLGLCEAPLGAHPQSLRTGRLAGIDGYLDDYAFLTDIVSACKDPQTAAAWYEQWVGGVASHAEYLERLGEQRRAALVFPAPPGPPAQAPAPADVSTAPTEQEQLIVLGARTVAELVRERGYDTLLAGIGTSHMSAWLAARLLARDGIQVQVAAELGLQSMDPEAGDVFLFSQRHAERSQMLTGVAETLGGAVAANPRCLGVLSAAEIDPDANINTTLLPDGRWITGSGGANDIASSVDCVVIAVASPRRYVPRLTHLTSPGLHVRDVVSQFGRFARTGPGTPFELTSWLPPVAGRGRTAEDLPDGPEAAVRELTGWDVGVGRFLTDEKAVTTEELALLRTMDPEGCYR
ncbi:MULTISPECIES: CoA-transferase [Streptomyces]|uniref:Acetate CoA-transferase n=1 Tax=Streptomyces rhizosphaericola TaxID=2564098 RepID=A0ABY2PHD3_9ACTN|nr:MULTISPECIES: CoA-transferase [Streptomyces]MYT98639.1 acetate CoA-transferase [Streptomyces sp. SID8350]TGZ10450.1 acetate CoA-transferase [Streptomyces rhizosphaericola]SCK60184.1 Acyl CoA:acetate/3-ketoacid CoA transferase, alpha subunit [Streptomyces sp. AmelKG-D3]